jgi:hypothetical protein
MAARVGSVVVLVAAWQIVAMIASAKTLPPPWDVLAAIAAEARSGDLLVNIGVTLWRVLSSFLIAMGAGCVAGVALGRSPAADRAIDSWLILLLNTPALVIAVLCYLWLGLTETAAITAVVLNKFPNVVVIVREGARSLDPALDEMSEVYRFSFAHGRAMCCCRNLRPTSPRRRGRASRWCGRSFWSWSFSGDRTASATPSRTPSSCSTSGPSSPTAALFRLSSSRSTRSSFGL